MDCLSRIPIDILRDAELSGLWVDLEQGVFFLLVKAVRQRVQQCAKLRAVCICGNNLDRRQTSCEDPKDLKHFCVYISM